MGSKFITFSRQSLLAVLIISSSYLLGFLLITEKVWAQTCSNSDIELAIKQLNEANTKSSAEKSLLGCGDEAIKKLIQRL